MAAAWAAAIIVLAMVNGARAGKLHIEVVDETGKPAWTRLEVRGEDGKLYRPPSALHDETARNRPGGKPYYLESFVADGHAAVPVPPGSYLVVAEHGLEYERAERTIKVVADRPASVRLTLRPWIRMRDRGWWSADMHVHRKAEDIAALARAEDVNLSVVFTMWNVKSGQQGGQGGDEMGGPRDLHISSHHIATFMNAEDERGGGAWMLHGLARPPEPHKQGFWFPPGVSRVRWARASRPIGAPMPWFEIEKPIWWEAPVVMATELPDSLGLLHNHFNQYGIVDEDGGRPRDRDRHPGPAGFVDYSLELYYRFLNLGFRVPISAGSASGVLPNPLGYNRVYVPLPEPFTVESWYSALKKGGGFVTNGPMLFTSLEGAKLSVEAIAREPIDRIEVVANGEVIDRFAPAGTVKKIKRQFTVPVTKHSWVAVRCFTGTADTIRLAHSSPIDLPGKWNASTDAEFFLAWIDDLVAATKTRTKLAEAEKQELLRLYAGARSFYSDRHR